MKQTIEIEVPDGKVAVWKDGFIVFEDAKPPLPKTWLEFVETQSYENTQIIEGVPQEIALQHIALLQLHKLRDCYRQGWMPDWKEDDGKWVIYRQYNKPSVHYAENSDQFLSFPSEGLAEEFLRNFRDLIEQAGDLI